MKPKASTVAQQQLPIKDFLSVRVRNQGLRQVKSKGKQTTLTATATAAHIKTAAVQAAAAVSNQKKTPVPVVDGPPVIDERDVRSHALPNKSAPGVSITDHSVGRAVTPKRSVAVVGRNDAAAAVGTASTTKRKFVDDDDALSDPTAMVTVSATNKTTRRRLFAPPPTKSGTQDPIAIALEVAAATKKRTTPISKREKYAHLLEGKRKTTPKGPPPSAAPQDKSKSRYRYLLTKDNKSLRLPFKYQILLAKFLALETVCMIQGYCRGKTVTFDSARSSVERTCSKEFTEDDLARIMTVYPDAYHLSAIYRHGRSPEGIRGTVGGYHRGRSSIRISVDYGSDTEVDACMSARKETFSTGLMDITKTAHQMFLQQMSPPLSCEDKLVMEWHPDFHLDNVPDVKKAALPACNDHVPSAADVLNRTCSISTTVKRALDHVIAKQSIPKSPVKKRRVDSPTRATASPTKRTPTEAQAAPRGKPMTLLERIRLKERLIKEEKMRSHEETLGASQAKRQWECAMILRSCAIAMRRTALPTRECVTAITRNIKVPMAEVKILEILVELSKEVPQWCSIKKVQDKKYFTMVPLQFAEVQTYFESQNVH